MSNELRELITIREAARLVSCHPNTLRIAIRGGNIKHYRIGRAIRLKLDDLIAWMANGAEGAKKFGRKRGEKVSPCPEAQVKDKVAV